MIEFKNLPPNVFFELVRQETSSTSIPLPSDLVTKLDGYVVGQDQVKRDLATLVVNHLIACQYRMDPSISSEDKFEIGYTNALLVGPTGSGKTFIISKLASILDIPFLSVDITNYTQAGYVGRDVDDILEDYTKLCSERYPDRGDGSTLPAGIIFIDEIDKIGTYESSADVGTLGVQRQLLKLLEGATVTPLSFGRGNNTRTVFLDTRNILWLFSGAFTNYIADKKKKLKGTQFGLVESKTKLEKTINIDQDFLKDSGLYAELLGRICHVFALDDLTVDQYYKILTATKGCLKDQMELLFELRGLTCSMTEDDWYSVAEKAFKLKLGARALKTETEKQLFSQLYK